jgi:hypothetical protein
MGSFQPFKRFYAEEFPKQKDWIAKLFGPLNEFLEKVSNLLKGNVSVTDNIACQVNALTVTEVPFEFRWTRTDRPIGVLVLSARDAAQASVGGLALPAWAYTSGGNIRIETLPTLSVAPSSSNPYTITLLTLAG